MASNVSSEFELYHQCHDATLALALALNQTIRGSSYCCTIILSFTHLLTCRIESAK